MNEYMTTAEVAARWGLRPATLRTWRTQGRGPAVHRLGGAVRYRRADVEAYEAAGAVAPANSDTGRA